MTYQPARILRRHVRVAGDGVERACRPHRQALRREARAHGRADRRRHRPHAAEPRRVVRGGAHMARPLDHRLPLRVRLRVRRGVVDLPAAAQGPDHGRGRRDGVARLGDWRAVRRHARARVRLAHRRAGIRRRGDRRRDADRSVLPRRRIDDGSAPGPARDRGRTVDIGPQRLSHADRLGAGPDAWPRRRRPVQRHVLRAVGRARRVRARRRRRRLDHQHRVSLRDCRPTSASAR